jgi:tRNA wybutosine-synthesizing protein 3
MGHDFMKVLKHDAPAASCGRERLRTSFVYETQGCLSHDTMTTEADADSQLSRAFERARARARAALERAVRARQVDEKIMPLIRELNNKKHYFTTSSCAGRIAVLQMPEPGDKQHARFLGKWHRTVTLSEVSEALQNFTDRTAWFLVQSPIFHVVARTPAAADRLVTVALKSGFKHTSYKKTHRKIVVELRSTERVDVPVGMDGRLLVDAGYLAALTEIANGMLCRMDDKLARLQAELEHLP